MSGEEQTVPTEDGDTRKLLFHEPFVISSGSQVDFINIAHNHYSQICTLIKNDSVGFLCQSQ